MSTHGTVVGWLVYAKEQLARLRHGPNHVLVWAHLVQAPLAVVVPDLRQVDFHVPPLVLPAGVDSDHTLLVRYAIDLVVDVLQPEVSGARLGVCGPVDAAGGCLQVHLPLIVPPQPVGHGVVLIGSRGIGVAWGAGNLLLWDVDQVVVDYPEVVVRADWVRANIPLIPMRVRVVVCVE